MTQHRFKHVLEIKHLDGAGNGLARIATLSAIDRDDDTYAAGAFGKQDAHILPAHSWGSVPLGRAHVYEEGDEALAELCLNLDTAAGREWHSALKFDLDAGKPLQEWSYGYTILDSVSETRDGARVRVIKRVKVHEVSPVIVGAGVGTATLAMKHASLPFERQIALALEGLKDIVARGGDIAALRAEEGRALPMSRVEQLKSLRAAIGDVAGIASAIDALIGGNDPEAKAKDEADAKATDRLIGMKAARDSGRWLR